MNSLERITVTSLAGALFAVSLNLIAFYIAGLDVAFVVFLLAMLALVIAIGIILPIVAIVEIFGKLCGARRNVTTLSFAMIAAVGFSCLIPSLPFEVASRPIIWFRLLEALLMAWLWWYFLPLPTIFTSTSEYDSDA